jgi:hypothetical protein
MSEPQPENTDTTLAAHGGHSGVLEGRVQQASHLPILRNIAMQIPFTAVLSLVLGDSVHNARCKPSLLQ